MLLTTINGSQKYIAVSSSPVWLANTAKPPQKQKKKEKRKEKEQKEMV